MLLDALVRVEGATQADLAGINVGVRSRCGTDALRTDVLPAVKRDSVGLGVKGT